MTSDPRVRDLLSLSLDLWQADAELIEGAGDAVTIRASDRSEVRVEPAEGPFRWAVTVRQPGESWEAAARARFPRRHGSVAGVLRSVRLALDPAWRPGRARPALGPGDGPAEAATPPGSSDGSG